MKAERSCSRDAVTIDGSLISSFQLAPNPSELPAPSASRSSPAVSPTRGCKFGGVVPVRACASLAHEPWLRPLPLDLLLIAKVCASATHPRLPHPQKRMGAASGFSQVSRCQARAAKSPHWLTVMCVCSCSCPGGC